MQVDTKASSAAFVYPFVFDPATFAARLAAVGGAEVSSAKGPTRVWCDDTFPSEDLLPQVAGYLNPGPGRAPTACVWRLNESLNDAYGLVGRAQWYLLTSRTEIPFGLGETGQGRFAIQLALFQTGVGFLTMRAHPKPEEPASWLDFVHYIRFVAGQRGVSLRATKVTGFDQAKRQQVVSPFFPAAAGGLAGHPEGRGTLADLMASWLSTGQLSTDTEQWWRDTFVPGQLLPYVSLFLREIPETQIGEMLYRLRNFFHFDEKINPTPEDLSTEHPSLLPYAERQWFEFSLDGGAFMACDAPDSDFFRNVLPDHLGKAYFMVFLLALHQRFALMRLSRDVAEHWLDVGERRADEEREEASLRIRRALLDFTARAHFAQVMQREHHHRCYRRWLEVFQIEQLYGEVRDEVQDMFEFMMLRRGQRLRELEETRQREEAARDRAEAARERAAQKRAERLERLLAAIAAVYGLPMVGLAFLAAIRGVDLEPALWTLGGTFVLGLLAYAAIHRWAMRETESDGRKNRSTD